MVLAYFSEDQKMSVVVPPEESSKSRLVILEADSEAGDSSRTFVFRHFRFTPSLS
jgi:hypothetical protein